MIPPADSTAAASTTEPASASWPAIDAPTSTMNTITKKLRMATASTTSEATIPLTSAPKESSSHVDPSILSISI